MGPPLKTCFRFLVAGSNRGRPNRRPLLWLGTELTRPEAKVRDVSKGETMIPLNASVDARDAKRLAGQSLAIYERLRQGPATNAELSGISLKYTSRLSELKAWVRERGGDLYAQRVSGGTWRYTLREPGQPTQLQLIR